MKTMKKTLALVLSLSLLLLCALTACGSKETVENNTPTAPVSAPPSDTPTQTPSPTSGPEPKVEVNLGVLSGPTGMGAAKLMADNDAGTAKNHYNVTVETDNSAITTKLINGEYDIAAVATNLASTLYHKTNGGVQIAAINTLGVLYILGRTSVTSQDAIDSIADLEIPDEVDAVVINRDLSYLQGKTILAFGQSANPEYVLDYLLTQNGLDPDADVDIQWKGAADEVTAAMLAGEADFCVLPVPAATALQAKSEGNIQPVFDLSAEWDKLENGSQLTMGCVVVRTEFAQEHPQAVEDFLEEYEDSIEFMTDEESLLLSSDLNPTQLLVNYGLLPSAGIAGKALPAANLVCITGEDMRDAIQGYYEVLFQADPKSIGGSIPDDAFYFLGN